MNKNISLFHLYRPSNLKENAPCIILLHGYGSDENDLFSFATEIDVKYAIISLRAPYTLKPYGFAWYSIYFDAPQGKWSNEEEAIKSRELLANVIDQIIQTYPIDKDNITLLGFSQGTILSFSLALSYPEKIKNVIGLSGYINTNILKEGFEKNNFNHLNIYSSHGFQDQVIPVDWARKTQPFLKQLNINVSYSEFAVGHGVAPQNFYEFRDWLYKNS